MIGCRVPFHTVKKKYTALNMLRLKAHGMDKFVLFNDEFQLAVCTACKSGIGGDMLRHFATHHEDIWKSYQKALRNHINDQSNETFSKRSNI